MTIQDFIDLLEKDREFELQVAGEKYIHSVKPQYMELHLDERLGAILKNRGIDLFYSHQVKTIDLIRQGENVVLMTPTASGKSLAYNIPVLESIIDDPDARSLYIFPLKGLEQDQLRNLNELSSELGIQNAGDVYDGDTTAYKRKKIRASLPNVIFTNPDMLHLAIIPFHRKWEAFFRHLKYVIIDEIHTYRGVFGSHVAQVLRRLRRVCDYYESEPQFIAASATIANSENLAGELVGLPFKIVDESGSPSAGKQFFFINPIESPYGIATRLFVQCMKAGLRTIVFTRARKITELIYAWSINHVPELKDKISPYRAGFLPGERREIEGKLFSGELLGVISTSALELGVDIGGLDCCILCGYPGSVSSTWQRAGRVGRHGQESVVFLVALHDALDHYFMRHPDEFFEKSHEAAVIDPANENILKKHLPCAASELPLKLTDRIYDMKGLLPFIEELVSEKTLSKSRKGEVWFSTNRRPHREVGIRAVGERFTLVNESGRAIGELSGGRVFREAFPGAIYLHRGKQYKIIELDVRKKQAVCTPVSLQYYTQALSKEKTEIIGEKAHIEFDNLKFRWGALRITQQITGYERKRIFDRKRITRHELDMPEYIFDTEGLWTILNSRTMEEIVANGFDLGGTLHALEHALIASMPLFALCDRGDIGGLSHTCFPDFKMPVIFIYDGHEGGVGLSKRAMEIIYEWLKATEKIMVECPCNDGCPSCVQDPQCGNSNEPLDKKGARFLLNRWLSGRS
ncbi:MAG: DEAD/DEAH box helicase [Nitrospirota bacterium]